MSTREGRERTGWDLNPVSWQGLFSLALNATSGLARHGVCSTGSPSLSRLPCRSGPCPHGAHRGAIVRSGVDALSPGRWLRASVHRIARPPFAGTPGPTGRRSANALETRIVSNAIEDPSDRAP